MKLYLGLLIVWVFGNILRSSNKPIWLIGGSSGKAYTDNSAAFHKYLLRTAPHLDVYWVISKSSPDVARAQAAGPILYQESLRTYIYSLLAQVHIISHGVHDVPGCASAHTHAVKVRLGHGLTASGKTRGSLLHPTRELNRIFNLVPVSSLFEKKIKQQWGFDESKLVVTGLARYDNLLQLAQERTQTQATILYMPTWRDWLDANQVADSSFFNELKRFLLDSELHDLLARHNIVLELYIHIGMWEWSEQFRDTTYSPNVRILPSHTELSETIVDSKMLITDYSSICWDYLYLGKPVLFFQGDLEEYIAHRGAYIDLRKDLFGPAVYSADAAVNALKKIVENEYVVPEYADKMHVWQRKAFAHRDGNNCARIFAAINDALQKKAR